MKTLILGCGFLGATLAQLLSSEGKYVIGTTTSENKKNTLLEYCAEAHTLNISDTTKLKSLLIDVTHVVVSIAAKDIHSYKDYELAAQAITQAIKTQPQVKHIVYTSSTSVYGENAGSVVDETSPLQSMHSHTQYLIHAETIFLEIAKKLPVTVSILRLGEIIGPGREPVERLKSLGNRQLPGNGQQCTNIIHVIDAARAIKHALANKLEGIYNIVNDVHIPRAKYYQEIAKKHSIAPPTWNPQAQSIHGGNKLVTNDKIKKTGFTFLFAQYPLQNSNSLEQSECQTLLKL